MSRADEEGGAGEEVDRKGGEKRKCVRPSGGELKECRSED